MSGLPTVEEVKQVLRHLLERAEFREAGRFLAQVDFIETVSGRIDLVDLQLSSSAFAADQPSNPLPIVGYVKDALGEPLGEFLIWATGGKLDSLEYAEYLHRYEVWPSLAQLDAVGPR